MNSETIRPYRSINLDKLEKLVGLTNALKISLLLNSILERAKSRFLDQPSKRYPKIPDRYELTNFLQKIDEPFGSPNATESDSD